MDKFWWRAAWGLFLVQLSLCQSQIDLNVTCRYAGVFHVEKNGRYSISRTEAPDLCRAFNSTLPTMDQMQKALETGFETCRYGFIDGHVVIPRIHPNSICAANKTGVYILPSNTSQYDTYCFNASAPLEEDCTSVTDLPNSFEGQVTINIVNRDGTRYTKKGEYRTNPNDINPSSAPEEDMSSGSPSERSTSVGYSIFHTLLPTAYPTSEQDYSEKSPTTSTDSNIISAGWQPTEENEDERDKHPSYSGSGIDDDEDFVSSTISTTQRVSKQPEKNPDWMQGSPSYSNPEEPLQTTTRMNDVDRSGISTSGKNWTQEAHPPLIHHEHHEEEETQHSASTTQATPSSTSEETTTQKEQSLWDGWLGLYPQTPKEDSHSTSETAVTTASAHESHPNQRMTTQSQDDSFWTDFFDPISHPMGRGHQTEGSMDVDSSHSTMLQPSTDPNTGLVEDLDRTEPLSTTTQQTHTQSFSTSYTGLEENEDQQMNSTPTPSKDHYTVDDSDHYHPTDRSGPDGHSSGSQEGGANTTSRPIRKSQIPEWLIILASLLALALILAVCIAVNSRRRCGQKKKLVINSGNGAVEDRKPSGLNGEASKSQEMVHLVNKEPSETPDQFMTTDETQNLQNVDVKIGV
ncbi:CD44 antigen isoform X4 [Erinaceus europaeus]|uniref:CD44 antigen n=1 Tax=Erinaceus europaeus TaxID=9365 RepID=A0ABM3W7N0_ERIEU|nr:CD44 antigen isoform X4 [Erinaceus europaeus]